MERERTKQASLFMWVLVAGLVSQDLVIPVMSTSFEDQKNYYSPDPHTGSPPTGSHKSPPHKTSPPHGSGGNCSPTPTPPRHVTPPRPHDPTPTPKTPTITPTPKTPTITPTPSTPTGGGGYYHSPPTSGGVPTPPVIISPPTSGGIPTPPVIISPPTTPIYPGIPTTPTTPTTPTPGTSIPSPPFVFDPNSPPFVFDPNSPPFTCNYWRTHPEAIWGLLGWWGTLGRALGMSSFPGFGANMSLQEALSNTRTDGIGALYREGTASLLNSMANSRFPYTTKQVRDSFVAAFSSNKAAAAQAHHFKLANEGRIKPRA